MARYFYAFRWAYGIGATWDGWVMAWESQGV